MRVRPVLLGVGSPFAGGTELDSDSGDTRSRHRVGCGSEGTEAFETNFAHRSQAFGGLHRSLLGPLDRTPCG